MDGDGDMDVVTVWLSGDRVGWFENDGAQNFTLNTISVATNGPINVFVADIDGDADQDVVVASLNDDSYRVYRNDGAQNFSTETITNNADVAWGLWLADVDGDGDLDVLSGSRDDDTVAWYENQPQLDYGDAPDASIGGTPSGYPVTIIDDGARHMPTGPTLGSNRDAEINGQPSANADGDDTAGGPDDEDGVTLQPIFASDLAGPHGIGRR